MKVKIGCSKNLIFIIVFILLLVGSYNLFKQNELTGENESEGAFSISMLYKEIDKVQKITVKGEELVIKFNDGSKKIAYKEPGISLSEYGITADKVDIEIKNPSGAAFWNIFFTAILPLLIIGGFLYFMARSAAGSNFKAMSFGKSRARLFNPNGKKTTFTEVAGLDEAKQELQEVVEFLKNPEKFKKVGAEVPKGVLLMGPPGTGKTLMARAVAGEAGVPFFSISASEFVEMFVGVGASRVRDLFAKAKRNAPAVLFIDELDAIGRQRGTGMGGGHDEREQTLNQILVEMDGFETDTRVTVIAATNRPDVLDSALLRPGRFDRRIVLDLPNKKEREEILKIHSIKKPLYRNVSFARLAAVTAGLSGADLKNVTNEAAILAARDNRKKINQNDFDKAIERVILGPENKSRLLSKREKEITAYHEAAHALVGHILPNCDPIHKVSLISRGMALGYTWSLPDQDRHIYSMAKFEDEMVQLLSGRVAEKLIFKEVTTGAQNDLQRANEIAREMICSYGMSDRLGAIVLRDREEMFFMGRNFREGKNYSEKLAAEIDKELEKIIGKAEKRAEEVLEKNKTKLNKLSKELLRKEVLEKAEIKRILK